MPKPIRNNYPFNPRKLHKELREAGLKVVSVNSNGDVILVDEPSLEERQLVLMIKTKQDTGRKP